MGWTSCKTAPRGASHDERFRLERVASWQVELHEPVTSFYSAARCHFAADGRGLLLVRDCRRLQNSYRSPRLPFQVDYPTIQVTTFYPGASPDVIASYVTAPLERQFGQVPGLNCKMTSSSSDGCSVITLQFTLDLNIDVAEQQVQAAINAAATFLPANLPNPPVYNKTNPADATDPYAISQFQYAAAL